MEAEMMELREGVGRKSEGYTTEVQTARAEGAWLAPSTCLICSQETPTLTTLQPCRHSFCPACVTEYLEDKVQFQGISALSCPSHNCPTRFSDGMLKSILSEATFSKFLYFRLQASLDSDPSIRRCPRPGCNGFDRVVGLKRKLVCGACGAEYCGYCLGEWHGSAKCGMEEEFRLERWAKRTGVKFCPHCKVRVEKNLGCAHMTCTRCSYEWCWSCGLPLAGHFRCPVRSPHWANQPLSRCFLLLFLPVCTLLSLPIWLLYRSRSVWRDFNQGCVFSAFVVLGLTLLGLLLTPVVIGVAVPFSGVFFLLFCYKECECCDSFILRCVLGLITLPLGLVLSPGVVAVALTAVSMGPPLGLIAIVLKLGVWVVRCWKKDFLRVKGAPGYPLGG